MANWLDKAKEVAMQAADGAKKVAEEVQKKVAASGTSNDKTSAAADSGSLQALETRVAKLETEVQKLMALQQPAVPEQQDTKEPDK